MTPLDERCDDLLKPIDDDADVAQVVSDLGRLSEGRPSPRADLAIRQALAVHGRELALAGGGRSTAAALERHRRWPRLLRPRVGVPVAAAVAVLLSLGGYLHVQSPTPVSAQTVLHRAAAAGPGPNEATRATYHVTSGDGSSGNADVWIGYDASGTATQLALNMAVSGNGQSASGASAGLTVVGPGLSRLYDAKSGQLAGPPELGAHPTHATAICTGSCVPGPSSITQGAQPSPTARSRFVAISQTMKGIVVGTLLAQKLSAQPDAYTLQQVTLDGVSVYALKPASAGGATFYFNAQTYALQGADWGQGSTSWQARLVSSSTEPLSAVPAHVFGDRLIAGPSGAKGRALQSSGETVTARQP